jgi:Inner membrane component of T3SS, cytoplasmic domain
MSFRLFVYYCALAGGWAGFVGWVLGRLLAPEGGGSYTQSILRTSLQGMFLGLMVAFGLSFLDASFSVTLRQFGKVFLRVAAAVFVGILGGLFGSFVGGSLFYVSQGAGSVSLIFFVVGWTIVGFLIGASISFYEIISSVAMRENIGSSIKKTIKCLLGGTVGGILGGGIALALQFLAQKLTTRDLEHLWSPSAIGFVAIGACIGLLVGLAQVILKEAWIKVEAGFRPGREMLLAKDKTSIGRAEGSDIALFGDSGVEKLHAHIVLDGGRYYLEDQQTPGGSYVNDMKVNGRAPLKTGDMIRVGKSLLRFNERAKRKD